MQITNLFFQVLDFGTLIAICFIVGCLILCAIARILQPKD